MTGVDIWVNVAGADVLTGEAAQWPFERKLAALVELRRGLRLRAARQKHHESREKPNREHGHPTLPTYSAARFCISAAAVLS